jgi:tight adherence protein B
MGRAVGRGNAVQGAASRRAAPRPEAAPPLDALAQALGQAKALAGAGLAGARVWAPVLGTGGGHPDLASWAAGAKGTAVEPYARAVLAVDRVAAGVGASTADLLGAVIGAVEDAQETDDARATAIAGPKTSARLLQFLPLLGLVLGTAMGAQPLRVLFGGGAGTWALGIGGGLLGLGYLWSSSMIRAAARPGGTELIAAAVLAAALRAGLPLPQALSQVGEAWGGSLGQALARTGGALAHGEPWDAAWRAPDSPTAGAAPADGFIDELRSSMWLVWDSGVEAAPLLEALRARLSRAERRRLSQAAARLGVYLMVPLGLCYLPAFVALGLIPVLLSLAGGLGF